MRLHDSQRNPRSLGGEEVKKTCMKSEEPLLHSPLNIESHAPRTHPLFGSCKVTVLSRLCSTVLYQQSNIGKYAAVLKGTEQNYRER